MEQIETSITNIDNVIKQKLNELPEIGSAVAMREVNRFLTESLKLKSTLLSLLDDDEEQEHLDFDNVEDDYIEILAHACSLVVGLAKVVDYKKMKQTKSDWLLEDADTLLRDLRGGIGTRIPLMPGSLDDRLEN